ncbi:toxin glutamine deamidase domain-containing protein [Propionicimonas sp.]|uniref:toxin glutamine deamidase domain-containing protein n=1 Tax=Propionicimonas sp. TaxID=1955623 RepID=UPI0017E6CF01|nr:toxin glutamine deamidase domain-containing protein [Propionicimonas sp.]MBU3976972.1 hypothetical protein [Actinomycetota bacterium]MBA3020543.1 hypothetical protein [Propionicimonas sp.]MBU3986717.1 hypothetical protein [Actinomycetota bacterium]MBU4007131.1 hypothetical protein [Actinomycetota bacterium]MBU4064884.1 hypothetical protein [Actinomycetota bacterium]
MRPSDWSPLGLAHDPTPGDPAVVRDGGRRYTQVADAIARAAASLRGLEAGTSNVDSVKALLETRDTIVDGVGKAEGRYRAAGSALSTYATVLDRVQSETANALHAARAAAGAGAEAGSQQARFHRFAQEAEDAGDAEQQDRWEKKEKAAKADAAHSAGAVSAQKAVVHEAVADRNRAAQTAISSINDITANDGLNDSWWDDWGAKLTEWVAKIAEAIATIAGILALLVCWIPVIGQALAAVLLIVAAIAGIVAALANILLAATGEKSWGEAALSVVFAALGCIGLGGLRGALGGLKAAFGAWKAAGGLAGQGGLKALLGATGRNALDSLSSLISHFRPGAGSEAGRTGVDALSVDQMAAMMDDFANGRMMTSAFEPTDVRYLRPSETTTNLLQDAVDAGGAMQVENYIGKLNPLHDLGEVWQKNCGPCSRSFADTFQQVETRVAAGDWKLGELAEMRSITGTHPPLLTADPAIDATYTDFTTRAYQAVHTQAANLPDGTALIVGVDWVGGGGHWFNGFVRDGKLHWADAQIGEVSGWPPGYQMPISGIDVIQRFTANSPWKEIQW